MNEVKPTVGRIVHYVVREGIPRAAIITWVNDRSLKLTVFDTNGSSFGVFDSEYDETGKKPGSWRWPPRT